MLNFPCSTTFCDIRTTVLYFFNFSILFFLNFYSYFIFYLLFSCNFRIIRCPFESENYIQNKTENYFENNIGGRDDNNQKNQSNQIDQNYTDFDQKSYLKMSPMNPLRLELYLAQEIKINFPKDLNMSGQYGVKCSDYLSLTFAIIHCIKSVTIIQFLPQPKSNQHQLNGNKNISSNSNSYCSSNNSRSKEHNNQYSERVDYMITQTVDSACLSAVRAHGRYIVLPVLTSALQWYLLQLLSIISQLSTSSSSTGTQR